MQFSSRLTIATHILLCIEIFKDDYKVTSNFLAGSINVNPVIVRNILGLLSSAGIVEIKAGIGGASLAKSPDEITMLDVFKAVEKEEALFHFHENPNSNCPVGRNVHRVLDSKLDNIQTAMENELAKITLSQLVKETKEKRGCAKTDYCRPKFAILNPRLTYTLPQYQTESGCVDILMHTMERYFVNIETMEITDSISEALMQTVIYNARILMKEPDNYSARAEIMWAGSLSHNGLTGLGRAKDFSVHKLGHALGAKYDKAHGATLSAVWGSWAEYVYKNDEERFAHYAKKVWGVEEEDVAKAAKEGIRRTVEYFREIHMPTNLKELEIGEVSEEDLRELSMAATLNDTVKLSKIKELTAEDVYQIFRKAAEK